METAVLCYYFAYGSNMNPDRMAERKVEFIKRELGELKDFALVFNKVITSSGTAAASIIADLSSTVYGALYTCTDDHVLTQLDKYEGVSNHQYYRTELVVVRTDGSSALASVYIANPDACETGLLIHPSYLEHLLVGKDILPHSYFDFLCSFKERLMQDVPVYHYFAYGPDMSSLALQRRGLPFTRRQLGHLSEYKLCFNKVKEPEGPEVLTLVLQNDSKVEGAVYKFYDFNPFDHLDEFYGASTNQCIRKQVSIDLNDGESIEAYVYIANDTFCNANL